MVYEDKDGWIEVRHLQALEDVNFEIYLKPSKKVFVAFEY